MKNYPLRFSGEKPVMKNIKTLKNQAGLTMLELLVAMTLGVIVLGAAVSMQVSFRKGFDATDNKLKMQTNARFAFDFISSSLREMGSAGCRTIKGYLLNAASTEEGRTQYLTNDALYKSGEGNSNYIIGLKVPSTIIADFRYQQELTGFDDGSTATAPPTELVAAFNPGTDVLIIKGAIGPTYAFNPGNTDEMDAGKTTIKLNDTRYPDSSIALKESQYAVISQCAVAEVFKMTGAGVATGTIGHAVGPKDDDNALATFANADGSLTFSSMATAELRRIASVAYYIANNPNGVPTLFRSVDGVASALVEGVEQMQILYGLDTDGDKSPDTYRDATAARAAAPNDNLAQAVSVRLSFIMRSTAAVYDSAVTKISSMPGETDVTNTDRFARQVFTTTIALRNRVTGSRTGPDT